MGREGLTSAPNHTQPLKLDADTVHRYSADRYTVKLGS